ncbi:MAG: addiction module protein [Candidatus Aminicenantes bacterium]|nr:addiction module protein [Candidatus Aminicenantes bacterium]NIM85124.1 addiction module protein [Candidatus Aminicenantes bacterium]NIN24634.1 addiction module protein [Candidatus Aminicenantes bacterium]NIN48395.1 addiction module protein [Candidatus Aminicenantes bacterium]NIN91298.1 addiction module protein [Candidatus Aminicenantes bacterium]
MIQSSEEVTAQAMALPPDARALLADRLLNSLDSPGREEIDRLWAEEAERRVQQIKNGEVELLPGEEVFEEIRKSLIS